jgi:serpin B
VPRIAAPFSLITALAVVVGCAAPGGGSAAAAELVRSDAPRAAADAAAGKRTAAAVEAFAADLYGELAKEQGNLVLSPYSVAVALAMTRAGASGETATQMDAVLRAATAGDLDAGFNALEQELAKRPGKYPFGDGTVDLDLATANQVWGQRGFAFERAYLDRLAASYGAGMRLVDYVQKREEARAAINEWVSERTHARIPKLIPEGALNELTRLVLTNAVYLKAKWVSSFQKGATAAAPFHRLDGSDRSAQLMQLNARLRYARGAGYQAVRLPYVGGLSMVVIVPDAGTFATFEQSLRADGSIRRIVDGLGDAQVRLRLPKFEFRTQAALKGPLARLGMPIAFSDRADFSGMSPRGKELTIQDVLHEGFISVDEEGTEAAAATAVLVGLTSAPSLNVELTVDRPFLFLIRDDQSGALLFMGRVVDPA